MDIKDLNKSQLILLAILLSFVTSIATGITTVTLMQQAPASVTTPVSRLVKQTIEKIEQVEGKTTIKTVIIKEEDLVVDAIDKNKSAVFEVSKEVPNAEGQLVEASLGRGFAVSTDGTVVVDGNLAKDGGVYYLKNNSGKFKAEFVSVASEPISFLKIGNAVDGGEAKAVFNVPAFGDLELMKVGQRILVLGNNISSFTFEGGKNVNTGVTKANAGSLVLNLDGEALGIALFSDTATFVSMKSINSALQSFNNKETPANP